MNRIHKEHSQQQGYLTFVQNNKDTDYLRVAYACGLSLKNTQKINNFAIIVDEETKSKITSKYATVFDHIIDIPWGDDSAEMEWKLANEWKAWSVTPFYETIKIDCDIIFTRNIDAWWQYLKEYEVMLPTTIRDERGNVSSSREYRRLFDKNNLPDVYSAFMYFRYSENSQLLFKSMHWIYKNWEYVKRNMLIDSRNEDPTTDVVLGLAACLVDNHKQLSNNRLEIPSFVHLKRAILDLPASANMKEALDIRYINNHLYIKNLPQLYPVHGAECKVELAEQVIKHYED